MRASGLVEQHGFYAPDQAALDRSAEMRKLKAQALVHERELARRKAAAAAESKAARMERAEESRLARRSAWREQLRGNLDKSVGWPGPDFRS